MASEPDEMQPDYTRFAPPGDRAPSPEKPEASQVDAHQTSARESDALWTEVPPPYVARTSPAQSSAFSQSSTSAQPSTPTQPSTVAQPNTVAQLSTPANAVPESQTSGSSSPGLNALRLSIAGVCVIAACIAAFASVILFSVKGTVLTRQHVTTAASQVLDEPDTQDRLVSFFLANVVDERVREQIAAAVQMRLHNTEYQGSFPPQLTDSLESGSSIEEIVARLDAYLPSAIRGALTTPQAHEAWLDAVADGHAKLLERVGLGTGLSEEEPISLDIGLVLNALFENGELGEFDTLQYRQGALTLPYLSGADVQDIRSAVDLVKVLEWALPVAVAVLLVFGLLVSPRRAWYLAMAAAAFAIMWLFRGPLSSALTDSVVRENVSSIGSHGFGTSIVEKLVQISTTATVSSGRYLAVVALSLAAAALLWWFLSMYHRRLNAGRTILNRELP